MWSKLRRLGSNQRGTCLTGTRNYQQLPLRNESARLDSNQRSRRPKRRGMTIFTTHSQTQKRPAGVEPALPPWQGSRLPLHHGRRLFGKSKLSKNSSGADGSRTRNVPVKSRVLCLSASSPNQNASHSPRRHDEHDERQELIDASERIRTANVAAAHLLLSVFRRGRCAVVVPFP